MIEKVDYSKYLSVDNGRGLLLKKNDVYVLNSYNINYFDFDNLSDLIIIVGNYLDDHYDEDVDDLEEVLSNLTEMHYYYEVNK